MNRKLTAAFIVAFGIGAIGCAKRPDNSGMGAGADTTGLRDTAQTTAPAPAPAPADTTKTPK